MIHDVVFDVLSVLNRTLWPAEGSCKVVNLLLISRTRIDVISNALLISTIRIVDINNANYCVPVTSILTIQIVDIKKRY